MMAAINQLEHRFVDSFPPQLEEGVIYVSMKFATSTHRCCCGCGNQVVTPISPVGWKLIFDGESISLDPSIGNWSFPCQSHYWIVNDRVRWAEQWSPYQIQRGRQADAAASEEFYEQRTDKTEPEVAGQNESKQEKRPLFGWWWKWFKGK